MNEEQLSQILRKDNDFKLTPNEALDYVFDFLEYVGNEGYEIDERLLDAVKRIRLLIDEVQKMPEETRETAQANAFDALARTPFIKEDYTKFYNFMTDLGRGKTVAFPNLNSPLYYAVLEDVKDALDRRDAAYSAEDLDRLVRVILDSVDNQQYSELVEEFVERSIKKIF